MTTLSFDNPMKNRMSLNLFDLQGRQLFTDFVNPGTGNHSVDLAQFPTGSYLIQVQIGAEVSNRVLNVIK